MAVTHQEYQSLTSKRRESVWKILPWAGIISLLLAFCCGIAALVIGIVSNGLPLNSWTVNTSDVQPSVLLSTAATLANALLRIAFADGVAIQWWLQAHQGASIEKLFALWMHGYTTRGLFMMLSKFSKVTFAAFAMFLLLADGPFLQRASSVRTVSRQSVQDLTVPLSYSPFVYGATGIITSHDGEEANIYTTAFAQVMQDYNARNPISISQFSESGTVAMTVIAPGWDVQCDNGSTIYRLMSSEEFVQWNNASNDNTTRYEGPPQTQVMFDTTLQFGTYNLPTSSNMVINSTYKSTLGINGTLSWRNCALSEAIIRYPLEVVDGIVTLQPMPLTKNRTEYLVYRQFESNTFENAPSTVGGIWLALWNQFTTSANITTQGEVQEAVVYNENAIASQFVTADSNLLDGYNVAWSDPIDTMIAAANEITLRAAIALSSQNSSWSCATCAQPEVYFPNLTFVNRTTSQDAFGTVTSSFNAYQTDLAWLVSGCAIIALVCIIVAPMYWGWWSLERRLTLNPFETAKAFDAPLLRSATNNVNPVDWSKSVKETRVLYGTEPQDLSNTIGGATVTMSGQPLKVYPMQVTQGDRDATASHMSSVSHEWTGGAGQPYEVVNDGVSKFRKLD